MGKNNPWGKLGKRVVGDCSTTQIIMNVCNELLTSCPWWGRFVDRDHVYDHLLSVGFFKKTLVPWCGDKMIRWSQSAISLQLNELQKDSDPSGKWPACWAALLYIGNITSITVIFCVWQLMSGYCPLIFCQVPPPRSASLFPKWQ